MIPSTRQRDGAAVFPDQEDVKTDEITFKLPTGETLKIAREDARVLAQRLWDIASEPGAAPIAVKISDAVSGSAVLRGPIDVSEREYSALRQVLAS